MSFINSCFIFNLVFLSLVDDASINGFGVGFVATSGVGCPAGSCAVILCKFLMGNKLL